MNLMDVLLFQDRRELVRLLKNSDSSYNSNSKREMVEILYPKLMNTNELTEKFKQLSNEAKRISLSLCYDQRLILSKEELHGLMPKLEQSKFKQLLNELKSMGILFTYTGNDYLIPSQIKKQLTSQFQLPIEEQRLYLPAQTDESDEIEVINDLFYFIDMVAERPLRLTKTGMIHKKDFQLMMQGFSIQETLPIEKWRFGYGRRFSQYPDRFSLIYDYCFERGWLKEERGYLTLGSSIDHLYNLKIDEFFKGIVKYWLKLYRRPIPSISLLYHLLFDLLEKGEGLEEECIIAEFLPFVDEYYFDRPEDIVKKRFLGMLVHLNLVKKVIISDFCCYTIGTAEGYVNRG